MNASDAKAGELKTPAALVEGEARAAGVNAGEFMLGDARMDGELKVELGKAGDAMTDAYEGEEGRWEPSVASCC